MAMPLASASCLRIAGALRFDMRSEMHATSSACGAASRGSGVCAAAGDDYYPPVGMRRDGRLFMDRDVEFEADDEPSVISSEQQSRRGAKGAAKQKKERGLARKARAQQQHRGGAEVLKAGKAGTRGQQELVRGEGSSSVISEARQARIKELKERKPPLREQVYLPPVLPKDPHVAIVGGGMAGLTCALMLERRGVRSTVFDTGKHGLGGRMGTRNIVHKDGAALVFDHAAQYFTVTDPAFQELVDEWVADGAVKKWDGAVGLLRSGEFVELPSSTKYVATHGMRQLADRLVSKARMIAVERPCWISSMEAMDGKWHLTENGLGHGKFDVVVVAHNGKCANRLLAPSGAPLVAKQMKRLELSSIWALLAAFDDPLPLPSSGMRFDGAFVEGVSSLSWMSNNTTKLMSGDGPQCWTFFSTAAYGKKHKVPQESIPAVKAERVRKEMLLGAEMALGLPEGSLPAPIYTRVQLWGAALPTNSPNTPCIFDPQSRVGICGDWLLGASLEAAALSGLALANHIADFCEKAEAGYFEMEEDNMNEFSLGLTTPLLSVGDGHDIGQFPGCSTPAKQDIKGRALVSR